MFVLLLKPEFSEFLELSPEFFPFNENVGTIDVDNDKQDVKHVGTKNVLLKMMGRHLTDFEKFSNTQKSLSPS